MFLGQVKQKVGNMKWWKQWIHQLLLYVGTARQGRVTKQNISLKARGIKQIEGPSASPSTAFPSKSAVAEEEQGSEEQGSWIRGSDVGSESGGSSWSDTDG